MYVVEIKYISKENNEEHYYYFGKENKVTKNLSENFIKKYGYKIIANAVRNYHYQNVEDDKFFSKVSQIVKVG